MTVGGGLGALACVVIAALAAVAVVQALARGDATIAGRMRTRSGDPRWYWTGIAVGGAAVVLLLVAAVAALAGPGDPRRIGERYGAAIAQALRVGDTAAADRAYRDACAAVAGADDDRALRLTMGISRVAADDVRLLDYLRQRGVPRR